MPKTFQIGHRLSLIQGFALLRHLRETRKLHRLSRKTSLDFKSKKILQSSIEGLFNESALAMMGIRSNGRSIGMNLINVAIFGASGYSGEELVRRLAQHPRVRIVGLTSRQHVGKRAADLFPWLDPRSRVADLRFVSPDAADLTGQDVMVAFLALPDGV